MKSLTCIVCPMGCSLDIDDSGMDNLTVTGNRCARGANYAQEEIRAPKRVVTATVLIAGSNETDSIRRVPVKTTSPYPKENIPALLLEIYKTSVKLPVKTGDVVITGLDEGIDVIVTRNIG